MNDEKLVPLHSLPDFQVADGYTDIRGFDAFLTDGRPAGRIRELLVDTAAGRVAAVMLEPVSGVSATQRAAGQQVPIEDVEIDSDARRVLIQGTGAEILAADTRGPLATADAAELVDDDATLMHPAAVRDDAPPAASASDMRAGDADQAERMMLAEEELALHKERVSAGTLNVHKRVETSHVRESVPVMHEEVTVERRAVNDPNASPEVRYEGDTMIVPVVEEELVVQKRTVVREELVIRRRQVERQQVVEADLRREVADVERHGEVREVADGGGMRAASTEDKTRREGSGGGMDGVRVR